MMSEEQNRAVPNSSLITPHSSLLRGYAAMVMLTGKMTGPHTMFLYALSGVTGEEMVVTIPVEVVP